MPFTIQLHNMTLRRLNMAGILATGTLLFAASGQCADSNLHERIDVLIEQQTEGVILDAQSDDSCFLRRVDLNLAERIPSVDKAQRFRADSLPSNRTALLDRLLAASDYPRRMQEMFHVMLMERRGDHKEWIRFLRTAFERNLPWHQIASAMLTPDVTTMYGYGLLMTVH